MASPEKKGRKLKSERVLGPYKFRRGYRIFYIDASGKRICKTFETEKQAKAFKYGAERAIREKSETIEDALRDYVNYKIENGSRIGTIRVLKSFIVRFFGDIEKRLYRVNKEYLEKCVERRKRNGRAVDTVATELRTTKTFLRYCMGKKSLAHIDLDSVKVLGLRKKGKEQLTLDESRRYITAALKLAENGDVGAFVAMCPLILGVRSRELLDRVVRDVDDDGKMLWIKRAKTERSNRRVVIPDFLQPFFLAQTKNKMPLDLIFKPPHGKAHSTNWLRQQVHRICAIADTTVVCSHGLRGTHATLAENAGMSSRLVAASLGHVNDQITGEHYSLPSARQNVKQQTFLKVLNGGKVYNVLD